jgi:hypothetical protein
MDDIHVCLPKRITTLPTKKSQGVTSKYCGTPSNNRYMATNILFSPAACFKLQTYHRTLKEIVEILTPVNMYRGADKSLARPISRCIMFDVENISFDASLVVYIYK